MKKQYDVVILGGGLAGLTLSLQLKKANPEISILVLEMRAGDAPDAAHKVGESTVELGTHYLREVLDLKDYLDEHQLPKHGLRFFFSPEHKEEISKRVELGPRELLPVPSHQLDRGTFENKLIQLTKELGTDVLLGAKATLVDLNEDGHTTTFSIDSQSTCVQSRWVVDATGRSSFLKRKLGFKKDLDHRISSAWFRVKGEIDVDDWSENSTWRTYVKPGLRRLSTVHFMGEGYWVWFIPLATGNTSIGIVADPNFHAFDAYNKFDKAMDWLKENEPLCYRILDKKRDDVLDFRVLKHFAHSSEKLYSTERWGVTGESGLFLDPFYSPGTDFIALNNAFLSDLILRDFNKEDIHLRVNVYERTHFALFDNWVPIYQDKYSLWSLTQTMVVKIFWDWATYWSVPTLLFTNEGYTNIIVLRDLFASEGCVGQKFGLLNGQMQKVFVEWAKHDTETFSDRYIDPFDVGYLRDFHKGIDERLSTPELIQKVHDNMQVLEEVATEVFRLMSNKVYGTPMDLKVDPYSMSLTEKPVHTDEGVLASEEIKKEVGIMWFY
ncbi:MAG: FAD-dependent monooxygenase [Crocinitomicaceae bacterium]|nr:FAD-dependent monooxygenase [Crocinitomicaceae bacterium]